MMGIMDVLFPVSEDKSSQEWKQYLTTNTAVSPGLAQWRVGQPVAVQLYAMQRTERYPTPVLHPSHKDYSSVETAKRRREDAAQEVKRRVGPKRPLPTQELPQEFPRLDIASPKLPRYDMRKFDKVKKRGY
jgi:hypothetical protein